MNGRESRKGGTCEMKRKRTSRIPIMYPYLHLQTDIMPTLYEKVEIISLEAEEGEMKNCGVLDFYPRPLFHVSCQGRTYIILICNVRT